MGTVKISRIETLDVKRIERFRKDFLILMKNAKRVDSYERAHAWKKVVSKWSRDFEDYLYRYLLEDLKGAARTDVVSKHFAKMWDKLVRHETWSFVIDFRVPIERSDDYWSKEARYLQFQRELPKWERMVRRRAQVAWKTLRNYVDSYEDQTQGELPQANVPVPEEMTMEGVHLVFKGHDSLTDFGSKLSMMRAALKHYQARASKILPMMLRHQLPLVVDFDCSDKAGSYNFNYITLCIWAFSSPKGLTGVIAHEMGHHLWKSVISGKAQKFWSKMLSGDLGKLDLREVLKKYGNEDWLFENKKLMRTNPFLYNQLMGIEYSHIPGLDEANRVIDIQEYLDNGGNPVISVLTKSITGYSNKNPEEAFCEALKLLVTYGPQTVHPEVVGWLRTILPNLKVASRVRNSGETTQWVGMESELMKRESKISAKVAKSHIRHAGQRIGRFVIPSGLSGRRLERSKEALEHLERGYQNKMIWNVDYKTAREVLNRSVGEVFQYRDFLSYWKEQRKIHGESVWTDEVDDLYYSFPSGIHQLGSFAKKLKKYDGYMKKEMEEWVEEWAPIVKSFKDLKPYIRKGRKPDPNAVKKDVYVAPKTSARDVKMVVAALQKVVDKKKENLVEGIAGRYIELADNFLERRKPEDTPYSFYSDSDSRNMVERMVELTSGNSMMTKAVKEYELRSSAAASAEKVGRKQAEDVVLRYLFKNENKIGSVVSRKGGLKEIKIAYGNLQGWGFAGELVCKFKDGTGFTVRNKVVYKITMRGTPFVQFPTTFHNVVWPDGKVSAMLSEKQINEEWAKA